MTGLGGEQHAGRRRDRPAVRAHIGGCIVIAILAGATLLASTTSYCPGSSGAYMADHHKRPYWGAAASNRHPFGTRIRLLGASFHGRRTFTIHDRIGHGSDLDLWAPSCAWSRRWGRRRVRYRVLGPREATRAG